MKSLSISLLTLLIFSCTKQNILSGDLYVKLINVHSLYGIDNQKLEEYKSILMNQNIDSLTESEKKTNNYFRLLIENDLFDKPHFKLKTKEDNIINVYTTETEFSKLSKELSDFDRDKEKISIVVKGYEIPNNIQDSVNVYNQSIYKAESITSIIKTDGITSWSK